MHVPWDGITLSREVTGYPENRRAELADAARGCNWSRLLDVVSNHPELVNSWRLGDPSWFAPLHHAANGGAPVDVVRQLLALGAWRTLQNARGERPVDVAGRTGHHSLREALDPVYRDSVPIGVLLKIQSHFHEVIRGRVDDLVEKYALRLPELEPLLEIEHSRVRFGVPGMYGAFAYGFESFGVEARLVAESWCRIVGGSGQRHEITSAGSRLVEEGFV